LEKSITKGGILISGLFSSIDSAQVQEIRFDTIANNVANANTNGFKKDDVVSQRSSFAIELQQKSTTDFTAGNIIETGNSLDVALDSPGFFKIETDQGERYTQNGAFVLDEQGYLVTENGEKVMGENGPMELGGGVISIGGDGTVSVNGQPIDQLAVVGFDNPQYLVKEGNSIYSHTGTNNNITQIQNPRVRQGFLEKSNVNPTVEMVKMMEMFRCHESTQQVIQTIGEMTSKMMSGFGLE